MEIYSERCLIRPFKEHDISDFMAYRNDMDWMKYQGFKGLTKQEYSKELLCRHSFEEGIQLAVICKKSESLIGDVYLKKEDGTVWIGYSICRSMARCGYAYEVVSAVITSLKKQGITTIKAGIDCGNEASIGLIRKLNFSYAGMEDGEQIFILNFFHSNYLEG